MPATGGGMGSGSGFLSGYGPIARSAYATPLELGLKTWTLDFAPVGAEPSFPTDARFNPYAASPSFEWQTDDWDPGLRFWTLPFDANLTEWLQDLDLSVPSVMAAREFAGQATSWQLSTAQLKSQDWLLDKHLKWHRDAGAAAAWGEIKGELDELVDLMEDERGRYLAEALEQADGIPHFVGHLLALDASRRPHTAELIRCGLAIGNLVYMHYKNHFRRVRPSALCPGLVPPFGPPQHPAFPSGHAFLGHFIALLLLEIPKVAERYGSGMTKNGSPVGHKIGWNDYKAGNGIEGPLFWLAARLARNRERIGVHYPSDSAAGRQLAGGIWNAIVNAGTIAVPTLKRVLARATAEWP